jgi:3,4-dihydroxy 2-butanone 4-phosphate synthase / GTP cyclohydrolase II
MKDDGSMARMPDLEVFAKKHGLRIVTIADLIQYRLQTERLVRRVSSGTVTLDETGTDWNVTVYEAATDHRQFVALTKGELEGDTPILCRMHAGSMIGDVFASGSREGGRNLREAIRRIETQGRGVIVYLPPRHTPAVEISYLTAPPVEASDSPLREFGLGAQVLADLGLHKIKLLTNNPRKIAGLSGFGLEVTGSEPLGTRRE